VRTTQIHLDILDPQWYGIDASTILALDPTPSIPGTHPPFQLSDVAVCFSGRGEELKGIFAADIKLD
jgi:hypothetical protein